MRTALGQEFTDCEANKVRKGKIMAKIEQRKKKYSDNNTLASSSDTAIASVDTPMTGNSDSDLWKHVILRQAEAKEAESSFTGSMSAKMSISGKIFPDNNKAETELMQYADSDELQETRDYIRRQVYDDRDLQKS